MPKHPATPPYTHSPRCASTSTILQNSSRRVRRREASPKCVACSKSAWRPLSKPESRARRLNWLPSHSHRSSALLTMGPPRTSLRLAAAAALFGLAASQTAAGPAAAASAGGAGSTASEASAPPPAPAVNTYGCPPHGSTGELRCATTDVKTENGVQTVFQGWTTMSAGATCLAFTGAWCAERGEPRALLR